MTQPLAFDWSTRRWTRVEGPAAATTMPQDHRWTHPQDDVRPRRWHSAPQGAGSR